MRHTFLVSTNTFLVWPCFLGVSRGRSPYLVGALAPPSGFHDSSPALGKLCDPSRVRLPHHLLAFAAAAFACLSPACKSTTTSAAVDGGAPEAKETKASAGPAAAAERVLRSYLTATCDARLQYILSPEKNRATITAFYGKGDRACSATVDRVVDTSAAPCARVGVGSTCLMNAFIDGNPKRYEFELQRVSADDFKVDWRSSMPYNPMTFAAYRAKAPKEPLVFRVSARLSDYYNYQWSNAKATHYAIDLEGPYHEGNLHGYIAKAADGEKLFSVLEDGKDHGIMVTLKQREGAPSDHVDIVKFVRADWREDPAEF